MSRNRKNQQRGIQTYERARSMQRLIEQELIRRGIDPNQARADNYHATTQDVIEAEIIDCSWEERARKERISAAPIQVNYNINPPQPQVSSPKNKKKGISDGDLLLFGLVFGLGSFLALYGVVSLISHAFRGY